MSQTEMSQTEKSQKEMSKLEILFYEKLVKSRSSTISTRRAHLKKLQDMEIDINNLNNNNVKDVLTKLQLTSNKNGRKLTASYINIIYSTLRKLNPSLTVKASKLDFSRRRRFAVGNPMNNIDIIGLKDLITTVFRYAITFKAIDHLRIPSRAIVDTAISMILVLTTNINFYQLMKLRVRDLKTIAYDNSISVAIKSGSSTIKVKKIAESYEPLFICIINMILSREEFMKRNYNNNVDVKYNYVNYLLNDDVDDEYCERLKISKVDDDEVHVISCKKDSINKTIHDLYMRFHRKKPTISLGITLVKKMKGVLIDTKEILSLLTKTNNSR